MGSSRRFVWRYTEQLFNSLRTNRYPVYSLVKCSPHHLFTQTTISNNTAHGINQISAPPSKTEWVSNTNDLGSFYSGIKDFIPYAALLVPFFVYYFKKKHFFSFLKTSIINFVNRNVEYLDDLLTPVELTDFVDDVGSQERDMILTEYVHVSVKSPVKVGKPVQESTSPENNFSSNSFNNYSIPTHATGAFNSLSFRLNREIKSSHLTLPYSISTIFQTESSDQDTGAIDEQNGHQELVSAII